MLCLDVDDIQPCVPFTKWTLVKAGIRGVVSFKNKRRNERREKLARPICKFRSTPGQLELALGVFPYGTLPR